MAWQEGLRDRQPDGHGDRMKGRFDRDILIEGIDRGVGENEGGSPLPLRFLLRENPGRW